MLFLDCILEGSKEVTDKGKDKLEIKHIGNNGEGKTWQIIDIAEDNGKKMS